MTHKNFEHQGGKLGMALPLPGANGGWSLFVNALLPGVRQLIPNNPDFRAAPPASTRV